MRESQDNIYIPLVPLYSYIAKNHKITEERSNLHSMKAQGNLAIFLTKSTKDISTCD